MFKTIFTLFNPKRRDIDYGASIYQRSLDNAKTTASAMRDLTIRNFYPKDVPGLTIGEMTLNWHILNHYMQYIAKDKDDFLSKVNISTYLEMIFIIRPHIDHERALELAISLTRTQNNHHPLKDCCDLPAIVDKMAHLVEDLPAGN